MQQTRIQNKTIHIVYCIRNTYVRECVSAFCKNVPHNASLLYPCIVWQRKHKPPALKDICTYVCVWPCMLLTHSCLAFLSICASSFLFFSALRDDNCCFCFTISSWSWKSCLAILLCSSLFSCAASCTPNMGCTESGSHAGREGGLNRTYVRRTYKRTYVRTYKDRGLWIHLYICLCACGGCLSRVLAGLHFT